MQVSAEDGSVEDPRDDFDAFYREQVRGVLGYLARATGRTDTAAELTADTFAAALTSRRRFDPDLGSPRQWVFGIARHQLQKASERGRADERLRRRLRITVPSLDDEAAAAVERLAAAAAGPALEELPALYREAVRARVVEEHDYEEIASVQGVSQAAVRQRVARGLAALRARLGEGP